jgi:hypothetical protein
MVLLSNLNLNFKQILNETLKDRIKLSQLLSLVGIAYIDIQKLGILSYTGLTASQVRKVAQEMDRCCKNMLQINYHNRSSILVIWSLAMPPPLTLMMM